MFCYNFPLKIGCLALVTFVMQILLRDTFSYYSCQKSDDTNEVCEKNVTIIILEYLL